MEYSLARVPQSFTPFGDVPPNRPRPGVIKNFRMYSSTESCLNYHSNPILSVSDPATLLFYAALIYFGYLLFKSCVMAHRQANGRARRGPGGGRGNNEGWSSWFGGGSNASDRDPPPPYYPNKARDNRQILPKKGLGPQASGQVSDWGASRRRFGIPGMTQVLHVALVSVQRCCDSRNMIGREPAQPLHRLGSEGQVLWDGREAMRAIELVHPHWERRGVVQQ